MKISTKGRYGIRAMIDLAIHSNGGYVSLGSIAERQGVSLNYLEHSFSTLKKAGFIISLAGSNGGYKLNREPGEITIQMLLSVLEGEVAIVDKIPENEETILQKAIRENVWDKINADIKEIITTTTLQDMMHEYKELIKTV